MVQNKTAILASHIKFPKRAELDKGYRDAYIISKIISKGTGKYLSQNQVNGDLQKEVEDHDYGDHTKGVWGAVNEAGADILGISWVYIHTQKGE